MRPADTAAAACAVGCRVVQVHDDADAPRLEIDCPDAWSVARLLVRLSDEDAIDPVVRNAAARIGRIAPSDEAFARLLHAWVQRSIRFEREKGEIFQAPAITIARRVGDCDCHARLVRAVLTARGIPSRIAFLVRPSDRSPSHAVVQVRTPGGWRWMETTVRGARFGEHPIDAAKRAGVVRADIDRNQEVVTMGGAIGLEGGGVYQMRIGILHPFEAGEIGDRAPDEMIRDALGALGLVDVVVHLDAAPSSFPPHLRGPAEGAAVTAWAEGLYAEPESRMLETPTVCDAEIPFVIDEAHQARRVEPAIGAVDDPAPPKPEPVYTRDLPERFFAELKKLARDVRAEPHWLLDIMWAESGIKHDAKYRNPPHYGTGLIGFVVLEQLGFHASDDPLQNHEAFARLGPVEQLAYARKFWMPWKGRFASGATLYQINFVPASVTQRGTHPEARIVVKDGTGYGGQEATFYRINRILDVDGDGVITPRDLAAHLERQKRMPNGAIHPRYAEARARLAAAPEPEPDFGPGTLIPLLALATAIWYSIKS